MMSSPDEFDLDLRAALELDEDEHAYLSSLNLAGAWRTQSESATDSTWGWVALFGVVSAFFAWTALLQPFLLVVATANLVGVGTVALTSAVGLLLDAGRALIDMSTNPALGLSQPLLALLALALLFWPRIKSAPTYLQGVRS
jgi:hypothetical protein